MAKFKQGEYHLIHPEKYIGKTPVFYKSGLEQRVFSYLDLNNNVLEFSYEPFAIPYFKPIMNDNKIHMEERKYWIDFYAKIKSKNSDEVKKYLIEVKSKSETLPPVAPKKVTFKNRQRLISEQMTFAVNSAKWRTASTWAKQHDMEFIHLTSDMIN